MIFGRAYFMAAIPRVLVEMVSCLLIICYLEEAQTSTASSGPPSRHLLGRWLKIYLSVSAQMIILSARSG